MGKPYSSRSADWDPVLCHPGVLGGDLSSGNPGLGLPARLALPVVALGKEGLCLRASQPSRGQHRPAPPQGSSLLCGAGPLRRGRCVLEWKNGSVHGSLCKAAGCEGGCQEDTETRIQRQVQEILRAEGLCRGPCDPGHLPRALSRTGTNLALPPPYPPGFLMKVGWRDVGVGLEAGLHFPAGSSSRVPVTVPCTAGNCGRIWGIRVTLGKSQAL